MLSALAAPLFLGHLNLSAPAAAAVPTASDSADHAGSAPGTRRWPTRVLRENVTIRRRLELHRLRASMASKTFLYEKLGFLKRPSWTS